MTPSNNSNWEFPVLIPKSPVKKALKNLVGKIAQLIKPEIRNELLNGKIPSNKIERAILCSIFIELKADNKYEKLAELHRQIWSSNHTQGYFDLTSGRMQGMFNLLKEPLYETITNLLSETDYQELIEIGCGEGIVVKNLLEKFNGIPNFVGIDINQAQIEINNNTSDAIENLSFVAGDITSNINLIKESE